jgi:hypothetical protein
MYPGDIMGNKKHAEQAVQRNTALTDFGPGKGCSHPIGGT